MLADGIGAGIEQAVDRVLLVLLLLVLHRAVLPTGIAIVLRCDAVTVLRHVTVRGQKILPAAFTLAGRVTVLKPIQQIEGIEAHKALKEVAVDEYHFLFVLWMTGKHIGGFQFRCDGECRTEPWSSLSEMSPTV